MAKDTDDTYGDGKRQASWKHCFSMASSAIRRDVWAEMPFNDRLTYSEDIDWTWRARQRGYEVRYMPESRVFHSHNYTLGQSYRRHRGRRTGRGGDFSMDRVGRKLCSVHASATDTSGGVGLEILLATLSPVFDVPLATVTDGTSMGTASRFSRRVAEDGDDAASLESCRDDEGKSVAVRS